MTQQGDTTSQEPDTGQPGQSPSTQAQAPAAKPAAPWWPSPYLVEGQAAPEAYPAPARPGQPKYGTAATPFQAGPSQPGYGQAGYGQPGYRQPGYGQPGGPRPFGQPGWGARSATASRPMARRDPALAGAWERLLASTVDWMLLLGVSFLILHTQVLRFWTQLQAVLTKAESLSPAAGQALYTNFAHSQTAVSAIVDYFLVVFGIALAYFWTLHVAGGATVGKRVLGLRVVTLADRSGVGVRAAGIRTVVFLLGPAIFTFAPKVAFLGAGILSTLGGIFWLADGLRLVTDPQRRSLHDRLAGTVVVRKAALSQQQPTNSPW
jgi:uncharacterized RDD family membrane protein YckC